MMMPPLSLSLTLLLPATTTLTTVTTMTTITMITVSIPKLEVPMLLLRRLCSLIYAAPVTLNLAIIMTQQWEFSSRVQVSLVAMQQQQGQGG